MWNQLNFLIEFVILVWSISYSCSLLLLFVVSRKAPKEIYTLIPGSHEYVILHGKRDFIDVIKVMDFN